MDGLKFNDNFRILLYKDNKFTIITLPNGMFYDEAADFLDYHSIVPVGVNINGKTYAVLCDEEAEFKGGKKHISIGITDKGTPSITGNIIIMTIGHVDEFGDEWHEDLTDEDIASIKAAEKEFGVYDFFHNNKFYSEKSAEEALNNVIGKWKMKWEKEFSDEEFPAMPYPKRMVKAIVGTYSVN